MKQNSISTGNIKKQTVMELTSHMLYKHYCENDVESVVSLFDKQLSWFGAGENEYATDPKTVAGIFRQFKGMVPKCNITDEQYHVMEITSEVYLCTGRMWITTDPSTNIYLRTHQRVTTVFRWVNDKPYCCHLHISNPYSEMLESDVGFPMQIGNQSYEYLQKCISEQKKQLEEQASMLQRMSFEDLLTGLFNQNKFNYIIDNDEEKNKMLLGVAAFDINGLKEINDSLGHHAGDDLIRRAADHIKKEFFGKAFRIGGDEFLVIDEETDKHTFQETIASVLKNMEQDGISMSVGLCWRSSGCNIQDQFDEADRLMYQNKVQFYNMRGKGRQRR